MKFYCIPPLAHLDLTHEGDCYFVLAHLYKNYPHYREFFLNLRLLNPDVFITLDNGAAERSLVDAESLVQIVEELQPNEVIAPDVLFDKNQTLIEFNNFIELLKTRDVSQTKLFACPQGKTKQEWLECYEVMMNNPITSTIGLSKIAIPKCWLNATDDVGIAKSRKQCVLELHKRNWLGWKEKSIHLLGMGEPTEFGYYRKFKHIRSSDSCYTILAAYHGFDFQKGKVPRIPTPHDYFDYVLNEDQINLAKRNIRFLRTKYADV